MANSETKLFAKNNEFDKFCSALKTCDTLFDFTLYLDSEL